MGPKKKKKKKKESGFLSQRNILSGPHGENKYSLGPTHRERENKLRLQILRKHHIREFLQSFF